MKKSSITSETLALRDRSLKTTLQGRKRGDRRVQITPTFLQSDSNFKIEDYG